jgi:hypothetical protein
MRTAIIALLLLASVACEDTATPTNPTTNLSHSNSPRLRDAAPSQLEMARKVPGFGGYYIDPVDGPTVYLTDVTRRPEAERALSGFLSKRRMTGANLRVVPGAFDYAQLDGWYEAARPAVFAIAGVVLGDVDEGRNRVRIGVTSAQAGARVRATIAKLGIPAGAVIVEERAPVAAMNTLRDRVRPLNGGLQINFFPTPAGTPGPSLICTLGFNVEINGVRSFITNSHCSNVEGGNELPTQYYQSLRGGGASTFVGTEADDPQWQLMLTLQCPPPLSCRYSDAARVQYEPGAAAETWLGSIAQLDEITTSLADTVHTIAGDFTIVGERDPIQGEVANKVGRTTGWTRGITTATCVDVLALGTAHMRLCQTMVAALVDGGDSGSPVFFQEDGPNVTLLGILWGGSTDDANPEFAYSPLSGVKRELGNFRTF